MKNSLKMPLLKCLVVIMHPKHIKLPYLDSILTPIGELACLSSCGLLISKVFQFFTSKVGRILLPKLSVLHHILNTPNCCGGKGWFKEAAMPKARILRVSMGSIMPSSQRRAVL